jgi:hypothetical protein
MLDHRMGMRVARKDQFIPNFELKFQKDDIDRVVIRDRVAVDLSGERVYISPIEVQIPYKLYPGSEKDIEDAVYLFEIFKDHLDHAALKSWMDLLRVTGAPYGIGD